MLRVRAALEVLATARTEVANGREMTAHAFAHWTREVRDATKPCPPSELPESKLGPVLAKVRDYLRPAPGAKPDRSFDEVVARLTVARARELLADPGLAGLPGDRLWAALRAETEA